MTFSILVTHRFEKELKRLAKKYPSLKNEFAQLVGTLKTNPETGTALGNHCYKIRLAISSKNKGKSAGARIITYVYVTTRSVYLLTIYDKSVDESISTVELKEMLATLPFE